MMITSRGSFLGFLFVLVVTSDSTALATALINCHDGDTCRIEIDGRSVNVRLFGIEAPELDQPLGETSRRHLISLLDRKPLRLDCRGRNNKRRVCVIFADGQDTSFRMVREGLAWETSKHSKGVYSKAEDLARQEGLGVWGVPGMKSPLCHKYNPPFCAEDPMRQP